MSVSMMRSGRVSPPRTSVRLCIRLSRRDDLLQIVLQQIADAVDADVRGRISGEYLWVQRVMSLARKDRRQAAAPMLFHRCQNAQLVIDQHVMLSGIMLLDIVQFLFLMNIN